LDNKEIIIDGEGLILGRIASHTAKMALENKKVTIVNAEKIIITGNEKNIVKKYKGLRDKGDFTHGPFFPRMPDKLVRRSIRGMISYKSERGKNALRRVKVFIGIPREYEGKEKITIDSANIKKVKSAKFITIEKLSKELGAKW